ncbi:MAG: serine protease [Gammaproteobacteria bacterium SHHR-1]
MKNNLYKLGTLTLLASVMAAHAQAAGPQTRIVNGISSDADSYPWFVNITQDAEASCGGSLIHPSYVLTAAHCFEPGQALDNIRLVVGRQRLSESSTGVEAAPSEVIIHPNYDAETNDNDIALVRLAQAVNSTTVKLAPPVYDLTPGVQARAVGRGGLAAPANYLADAYTLETDCGEDLAGCIREATDMGVGNEEILTTLLLANGLGDITKGIGYAELKSWVDAGAQPTVQELLSAYGNEITDMAEIIVISAGGSDELREVDLPLIDNATCSQSAGTELTDNMFCAGEANVPKDTCQGDSGGPLFVQNAQGSDWLQIGIVSFGDTCATNYGVYAKVNNYFDWIEQYVPDFAYDRVFNWAESVIGSIIKPAGSERSVSISPFYARIYDTTGMAIGYNQQDGQLYAYDGANLLAFGPISTWIEQAKSDKY